MILELQDKKSNSYQLKKLDLLYSLIYLLTAMLPFIFLSIILFLRDPPVWPDEALFVDSAVNIVDKGLLSSSLFGDAIVGMKEHVYWMPPLYFYFLAGWIKIFGNSIETVRLFSLVISICALGIVFQIAKRLFKRNFFAAVTVFLVSLDYWFLKISKVARMEALTFFFLVLSLYLFLINREKRKWFWVSATGLSCGLGIITHPLGVIAIVIIGIGIIFNKGNFKRKLIELIIFGFPILTIILLWLFSMRDSFNIFIAQYRLQFERKAETVGYISQIFHDNTFTLWPTLMFLYFLIIIFLMIKFLKMKNEKFDDLLILISTIISISGLLYGKEMWYAVYFQPFIAFSLVSLLVYAFNKKQIGLLLGNFLGLIFVITINLIFIGDAVRDSRGEKHNYHSFVEKVIKELPEKGSVFIASIPDPYFGLKSKTKLDIYEFPPVPISNEKYKELLDNTDYIIVNIYPRFLYNYIQNNKVKIKRVGFENGYMVNIITNGTSFRFKKSRL